MGRSSLALAAAVVTWSHSEKGNKGNKKGKKEKRKKVLSLAAVSHVHAGCLGLGKMGLRE